MLNKKEFVTKYAETYELTKKQAEKNIEEVIDMIQRAVVEDDGVNFYGVMCFKKAIQPARQCRNPQTGELMTCAEKVIPKVAFSPKFKATVNGEE